MPLFDFECTKCAHQFEEMAPVDQPPVCPECGAATEKVLSVGLGVVRKKSAKAEKYTSEKWQKMNKEKKEREKRAKKPQP